jgi:putative glycosyltransferase (TIGR04372 family)
MAKQFHVVENRFLCQFLTTGFVRANAMVATQHYASAMYQTAKCFEVFRRWGERPPPFRLTRRDARFGRTVLARMGVPEDAWFVCVHAREGGFSPKDESFHSYRNVDIGGYAAAIDEITARGGWCIRLGDPTMKPLRPQAKVVDYALSAHKSDRMDVFLAASCRFFLGCASGLYTIATLFGRPSALINTTPLSAVYSPGINDLTIPQRLRLANGRLLGFEEIMESEMANLRLTEEFSSRGLVPENVDSGEIRDLAIEMLDRLEGKLAYSAEDELLQRQFRELFRDGHYAYGAGSRIGRTYLKAHVDPSESASVGSPGCLSET